MKQVAWADQVDGIVASVQSDAVLVRSAFCTVRDLFVVIVAGLSRLRRARWDCPRVAFVVSSPVAHGAKLAQAVLDAGTGVELVCEAHYSQLDRSPALDFPGLGPRALRRTVSISDLLVAIRLMPAVWRRLGSTGQPRTAFLYPAFAQSLRYSLATRLTPGERVVVDFDRAPYSSPLLWASRRGGATVTTLVHGSPSEANYLPLVADRALVWGEEQRRWFADRGVHNTVIVGRPDWRPLPVRLEQIRRLVVCDSMERLTPAELERLRHLVEAALSGGAVVALKAHPRRNSGSDLLEWESELGGSFEKVDGHSVHSTLRPGDLVVGCLTTATVEALIHGHPAVTISDLDRPGLPCDVAALGQATAQFLNAASRGHLPIESVDWDGLAARIMAFGGAESAARIRATLEMPAAAFLVPGSPQPALGGDALSLDDR